MLTGVTKWGPNLCTGAGGGREAGAGQWLPTGDAFLRAEGQAVVVKHGRNIPATFLLPVPVTARRQTPGAAAVRR